MRGRALDDEVLVVEIEQAPLAAEDALVDAPEINSAAAIVGYVDVGVDARGPDEPRVVARQMREADVERRSRDERRCRWWGSGRRTGLGEGSRGRAHGEHDSGEKRAHARVRPL
jgi:hypothetical protein